MKFVPRYFIPPLGRYQHQGKYVRGAIGIPILLTFELSLLVNSEEVPTILTDKPSFYEALLDMDRYKNLSSICEILNQGN